MQIKFEYDKTGELWQGFSWNKSYPFYDFGIIGVDWFTSTKELAIYFWRFTIRLCFKRSKP